MRAIKKQSKTVKLVMYRLKSLAKYERPEGLEFAVKCPVKCARNYECLSALFGSEIQIDRRKYQIKGFNVHSSAAPIKQGETVGVVVELSGSKQ